ncbi:helix-turn-helix transcriptional regulator [Roseateles depolymerans]|uniref:Transcriptional regulator n=1 Tax=Roseateles depolymerans TaxID=76731 RepID=A0A0U3MYI8_9BURK|nr:MarR family transcriptional regulator [Roseateles depolymerans]ALV08067.1 Transcriptional regulator [Roseateles depolymerans]REG21712.1 transcriptional regulator [Roseateles depolymerans]
MTTELPTGNEDRLLFELKSRGPQAAATLAAALAITPMGAHKLLARLEAMGLVDAREDTRKDTRDSSGDGAQAARVGRPRRLWALTAAGHGRFPDRHADLTLQLIQQARVLFGDAGLDQLITAREQDSERRYAAALSRSQSLAERVRELARLRSEEGYMARAERAGRDWLLVEDHCPICAAATHCQGFCRSELALFQRCLGPGVSVERSEHLLAGARRCVYRIAAVKDAVLPANGGSADPASLAG